jgi:hypothetical protein
MSKQLYDEALADVKKLKEIAEDNAKKALIEAVSPRIKDLIEAELLKETSDDKQISDDLLLDDGEQVTEVPDMVVAPQTAIDPAVAAAMSLPDEEGKVTLDLDAIAVTPSPLDAQFELSNESIKLINPIVEKVNAATALKIESKLFQLNESVEKFLDASVAVKKTISYQHKILEMVSEIETLYEYLQETAGNLQDKGVYEGKLEKLYKQLNKLVEQYNMKKNLKSLTEAEITLKLTNVPDEVADELDDLGVDLVTDEEGGEEAPEGEEAEGGEELDLGDEEGSEGGEEEAGEEELDLGDEEEEKTEETQKKESKRLSDNTIVEIDESMLRREIARMRSLREAADDVQSWGHGPGEVSDEFEDEDMGDPIVDGDLTLEGDKEPADEMEMEVDEMAMEMDELEELVHQAEDADKKGGPSQYAQSQEQKRQPEGQQKKPQQGKQQKPQQGKQQKPQEMAEVDDDKKEGMHQYDEADDDEKDKKEVQEESFRVRLAREARVQTEAKKKAKQAKQEQQKAKQKSQAKQLEAQQQAKKGQRGKAAQAKQEAQKQAKKAKQLGEAYAYYANIFNESVRRTAKLQSVLAESRKVASQNGAATRSTVETSTLRKKLAETNLFNTKLLYCNKLLQNESLTKRQKADIIERLDEAKSEREVKLVYESLVKTLGASSSRSLSEGTRRVLGSSSQTTRPASTVLSEGYEADRWARLAGLK